MGGRGVWASAVTGQREGLKAGCPPLAGQVMGRVMGSEGGTQPSRHLWELGQQPHSALVWVVLPVHCSWKQQESKGSWPQWAAPWVSCQWDSGALWRGFPLCGLAGSLRLRGHPAQPQVPSIALPDTCQQGRC